MLLTLFLLLNGRKNEKKLVHKLFNWKQGQCQGTLGSKCSRLYLTSTHVPYFMVQTNCMFSLKSIAQWTLKRVWVHDYSIQFGLEFEFDAFKFNKIFKIVQIIN